MTQASMGVTIGALFGTITTAANAVTGVVNTAAASVGMLDTYVSTHVRNQQATLEFEADEFEERIIERLSRERTERQLEVAKYTATSTAHQALYEANLQKLREVQAKRKGAYRPSLVA